ncbi:MAG: VWA domain-containing protein [Holophagaceae bacterium]|nr:VWA domain-containing protein [Holophagaceae bacterium]
MRRLAPCLLLNCLGLTLAAAPSPDPIHSPRAPKPIIQVAILLDTSNSMDGLIGQAKSQLWTFVNQFSPLRRDGQAPELQVALYEYGKSSIPAGEGHLRMVVPFTTDLDRVSEQLFALTTRGGDEYCGAVIKSATDGLNWSPSPRDLKVVFIAGNEPFTQGRVDYHQSCEVARAKGLTVNTIFCGSYREGVSTNWADGARIAGGSYMNIDQDRQAVHIPSPQDPEIERLGVELNKTYIPIGEKGRSSFQNQAVQDRNAMEAGAGAANERAKAKASGFYRADGWDLVDAEKAGSKKLESLDKKDLPKEMQAMKPAEARAYVDAQAKLRVELRVKIQKLSGERDQFIAAKRKELAVKGAAKTLDAAMAEALAAQAKAKGFEQK